MKTYWQLFIVVAFTLFLGAGCVSVTVPPKPITVPAPIETTPVVPTQELEPVTTADPMENPELKKITPVEAQPMPIVESSPTPTTTPEPAPIIKEFSITAKQWEFLPSTIAVNTGDTVKLIITSIDVAHGFTLEAFGIEEYLEPNKTTTVEFVADKAGSFSFSCSVFCGSGHNHMSGTLIVK